MKRPAFFVSRLYGAIAGHDGLEGATKDRTGNHPASTDNQGPGKTKTGKERGYRMHTASVSIHALQSCYCTGTHSGKTEFKNKAFHHFMVNYYVS